MLSVWRCELVVRHGGRKEGVGEKRSVDIIPQVQRDHIVSSRRRPLTRPGYLYPGKVIKGHLGEDAQHRAAKSLCIICLSRLMMSPPARWQQTYGGDGGLQAVTSLQHTITQRSALLWFGTGL